MRGPVRHLALAGVLLAAALACSSGPSEFPAADFTLKSPVTGSEVVFSSLRGKPVILYWFTSW